MQEAQVLAKLIQEECETKRRNLMVVTITKSLLKMKVLNSLVLICLILLASCTKHEQTPTVNSVNELPEDTTISVLNPPQNCLDSFFVANDLLRYDTTYLNCMRYFSLCSFRNDTFLYYDDNCADVVSIPFTCAGDSLCQSISDPILSDFLHEADFLGIFGVIEYD